MGIKLKFEQRFSVRDGNSRSTIWKVSINGSDVYITSRLTHENMKLSLHESGDCNYSYTSEYIKKTNVVSIENRHVKQWKVNPEGVRAEIAFELFIPYSELVFHNHEKKLSKVYWIDPPKENEQIQLVGYLTPKIIMSQGVETPENMGTVLIKKQLDNLKYFVLIYKCVEISKENKIRIEELKSEIIKLYGIGQSGKHGLMLAEKDSTNAFIEYHII